MSLYSVCSISSECFYHNNKNDYQHTHIKMNGKFNPKEIIELIRQRRSIKPERYIEGKIIPNDIILSILEAANWAPTHGLNEPWRFKIFAGDARHKLSGFLSGWYKEFTPAEKFHESKHQKYLKRPLQASHVFAICLHRKNDTKIPLVEDLEALACSVQNMHLLATAYGLGAYWNTGGATYSDETKAFLGLEENESCLGFFYLGYPSVNRPEGRRNTGIEEKIQWM